MICEYNTNQATEINESEEERLRRVIAKKENSIIDLYREIDEQDKRLIDSYHTIEKLHKELESLKNENSMLRDMIEGKDIDNFEKFNQLLKTKDEEILYLKSIASKQLEIEKFYKERDELVERLMNME